MKTNNYSKIISLLVINCLVLLLGTVAFGADASTFEQLSNLASDSSVPSIRLIADIDVDNEITFEIASDRTFDLNGHTLVLNKKMFVNYGAENVTFTICDSTDAGLLVVNGKNKINVSSNDDSKDSYNFVFSGGTYQNTDGSNSTIIEVKNMYETKLNVFVDGATFYQVNSAPFSTDGWNFNFKNMVVMGKNQVDYVGFINSNQLIGQVMDDDTEVYLKNEFYDCDSGDSARNIFFGDSEETYSIYLATNMTNNIKSSITVPSYIVKEGYTAEEVPKQAITLKVDDEVVLDGGRIKVELMGSDKKYFETNVSLSNLHAPGLWNNTSQIGIKPAAGLPIGVYKVFVKVLYDSNNDGVFEEILGVGVASLEVTDSYVDCLNYWGTTGDYLEAVVLDGNMVHESQSEGTITVPVGEKVTLRAHAVTHYVPSSWSLYYNGTTHEYGDFEEETDNPGWYKATITVPKVDFKIGIDTSLINNRVTYESNNGKYDEFDFYYASGDDIEVLELPDGWENGEKVFKGWYDYGQEKLFKPGAILNPTEPTWYDFYAKWGEPVELGDLDGDEHITIVDVRLLLQAFIDSRTGDDWSEEDLELMDMDGSGAINILDVRLLLQEFIDNG